MILEKIVSEGLSHNSYILISGGAAAVIDPRRDCDIDISIAGRNDAGITHIFETHMNDSFFLLDVRDINNRAKYGHIKDSVHIYVGELPERMQEVPRDRHVVAYCDAGYKGSLGASLLQKAGYGRVGNLLGGMGAWMKAAYPVEK